MSEKRFIVEIVEIQTDCGTKSRIAKVIIDTKELYSYDDLYELCDDINKLNDENEKLRQQIEQLNLAIDDLASHTSCDEIKKENEQLKKEINMLKVIIGRNESYIERLTHQSNWHC